MKEEKEMRLLEFDPNDDNERPVDIKKVSRSLPVQFAASLGFSYPDAYLKLALEHGGKYFGDENNYLVTNNPLTAEDGNFELNQLMHFDISNPNLSVQKIYHSDFIATFQIGVVPFVYSIQSTMICFDIRENPRNPSIIWFDTNFWDKPELALSPIVENFDAFLKNIHPWEKYLEMEQE